MKDLTISDIERQNVLNNRFAVKKLQERLDIEGMFFDGEYWLTKRMVADFYGVDTSTIDRYLSANGDELKHNGYVLCKGKVLKEFKLQFAHLINEASKTTQLGLFNFRSFLNIGMLLTESERAKALRSAILDIVTVVMAKSETCVAQIVVLSLGTCCPPREQRLLVSCSPVPHHVVPEGPLEEHGRNL